jgi:glutathione S-transferase
MMLELYHNNISVCAQKVRLVLAEKGLEWKGHHVDLRAGEQSRPEFLKINPKALVPALVHDGAVIVESTVICEYLDEAFLAPPLKPANLVQRARMRAWAKVPDDGIHVHCASVSFAGAFARQLKSGFDAKGLEARLKSMPDQARAARQRAIIEHGFDAPFVRDAVRAFDRMLTDMEKAMAGQAWLAGDSYTLAESCITPYVERLYRLGLAPMWERGRPKVTDWFQRIRARPSYKAALTDFKPLDYNDLLVDHGESVWPDVEKVLKAA